MDERCGVSAGFLEGWVKVDGWRGGRVSERWGLDWRFRSGLLTGGTVLLMRVQRRLGVGMTTLFLEFTSFFRSGIGLFSGLPPPTF